MSTEITASTTNTVIVVGMLVAALVWRAPWPRRPADWGHLAVSGLLMHGVYLGGVFVAIRMGLEAGQIGRAHV